MNRAPRQFAPRRALVGLGVVVCVAGVLALVRSNLRDAPDAGRDPGVADSSAGAESPPPPDPREPAASLETFLHVAATGGDKLSREAAIAWLDGHSRERRPPDAAAGAHVLAVLHDDGHPSWSSGYRLHLFNSAFNALHHAPEPGPLTSVLHHLLLADRDTDMRNYALQHLRTQLRAGRLEGPVAAEIRTTLESLAAEPGGPLAGLAIALLVDWGGPGTAPVDLALATAADRSRSSDVRVTAFHAAGGAALALAREVSTDTAEPVILRKAAISRLGRHGGAADLAALENLRGETGRLDQAVDPALKTLRARLADPAAPQPVPYRTRPIR